MKVKDKIIWQFSCLCGTFLFLGLALDETGRAIIHEQRLNNYPELRYIIPFFWICGLVFLIYTTCKFRHWSLFKAKRRYFLVGCLFTIILYALSGLMSVIVNELVWADNRNAGFGYTWSVDFIVSMIMFGTFFILLGYGISMGRKE